MKNWQLITLIGLTASFTGCATTENQKYQSRDNLGSYQTTLSIQNQHRRVNDDILTKRQERLNWDTWQ